MSGATPSAYRVFSQREGTSLEVAAWGDHAARFFGCSLVACEAGLSLSTPAHEGAERALEARRVLARRREPGDLALADAAEAMAGGGGLARLAQRCPIVWEVTRAREDDALALRLSAILASILLGPILDPDVPAIFGVKTARAKLEALLARA